MTAHQLWVGSETAYRGVGEMLGFVVRMSRDGWELVDQRPGRKPSLSGPFSSAAKAREIAGERVAR